MRVRTVKGQDYFCRSGAKFHGAMEQRFLLVDCHTTIFGSYSFTWSFEKINLSMVQVITGHLVKTFDEEFRTLYARSTVPPDLCPVEGLYQRNGPQGRQVLPKSHSGQIERKDQLRHTLDTVYRKTCERKLGARDFEERRYDEDPNKHGPLIQNGIGVHNRMTQLQSTEAMDYLKRHSYAGERQDEYVPQNMRPRASNWNISREAVNSTNNYHTNNYVQGPQVFRGQNVRQSYNGKDKEVMAVQQNMPTLENTSKSFMRTLRIESYLKNPDGPYGDSLDQFESQDKASCYMQRGMRSSYVFRSTKPEQMEPNRHINNSSTCFTSSAGPNTPMHYSSMQWNPKGAPENRLNSEEFMLKRPSLQMLDGNHCNKSYGSGRNSYQSAYTSLDRAQSGNMIPKPESLTDSWYKRHSVADPRSNTHESSGHVYGSLTRMQINRSTAGISTQNGGYKPNLNEDQRSVSHYDVKSIPSTKSPSTSSWKDPTSMTVSTAFQEVKSQDSTAKSRSSQHFIDKSSNKIKSIFNIPVKKGDSMQSLETLSLKSGTSTDTITAEDEVTMSGGGETTQQTSTDSVRSSSEHQRSQTKDDHQKSSKSRFRAEERRIPLQISLPRITTHKKPSILDKSTRPGLDTQSWSKSRSTENRVYSRFEPFCSLEKKQSPLSGHSTYSQDKPGSLSRGGAGIEHNVSRTVRGHHENKLEKFFHRVGNLIHKNK